MQTDSPPIHLRPNPDSSELKVPKMDKRLRKHPVICEQDQFNCLMGLSSLLDFRHSRLNQYLFSTQKRCVNKKGGDVKNKVNLPNPCLKPGQVELSKPISRLDKKKVRKAYRAADQCADTERIGIICRDVATDNSTDGFSKALEALNWNKELYLTILQDPSSPNLQDSQTKTEIKEEEKDKKIKYDNKHGHNAVAVLKPGPRMVPISEDVSCYCSINTHHSCKGQQSSKPVTFSKSVKKKCSKEEETWMIGSQGKSNSTTEKKKKKKKTGKVFQALSIVNDSKQKQFDIYMEAKRHMSQRLINLVQDITFTNQEPPKTISRILSLPKQDHPNEQKSTDPTMIAAAAADDDDQIQASYTVKEKQNVNKNGRSSSNCKLSSRMEKGESEEWESVDREDHPSPVSVLEPFFTDYLSSPSTPGSQSANTSLLLLPHRLDYEEYSTTTILSSPALSGIPGTYLDDYENYETVTISKYVKSVLRSCPLNWEDIFLKMEISGHESDQLFLTFFDELELCPIDSYWKHKILFDCTNEAFLHTCRSHFSSLAWLSGFNRDLFALVDHEVIDRVNSHFVHRPLPPTMQDLVTHDVMKTWTWMDLGFEIDCIATGISDFILDDLLFDMEASF